MATEHEQLQAMMDFDHIVFVGHGGTVFHSTRDELHAPELRLEVDADGQTGQDASEEMRRQAQEQGWTLLSGYTGQYGYDGPVMHSSETISGGLARDILERSGYYVTVAVECIGPDPEEDHMPAGWTVAFRSRV